ncbi:hypothetical protein CROQUDRAFT_92543 [Cronartium quercuum f. sp. fusiforme G11]|uniref:Uncharacterized protein n=1 Tax=Cronartium quercuum f. sp. fusiforme G11 TaxID=708437 RepID=A0A9P6NIE5_9BASI|nr:hypothetical protein CROQUDRAFT_92543 [Cronartium quercuum f. sp. fusiforme G11]
MALVYQVMGKLKKIYPPLHDSPITPQLAQFASVGSNFIRQMKGVLPTTPTLAPIEFLPQSVPLPTLRRDARPTVHSESTESAQGQQTKLILKYLKLYSGHLRLDNTTRVARLKQRGFENILGARYRLYSIPDIYEHWPRSLNLEKSRAFDRVSLTLTVSGTAFLNPTALAINDRLTVPVRHAPPLSGVSVPSSASHLALDQPVRLTVEVLRNLQLRREAGSNLSPKRVATIKA